MSRKKQATKSEKQAVEKPPIELKEEQLDEAQGGYIKITMKKLMRSTYVPADKIDLNDQG